MPRTHSIQDSPGAVTNLDLPSKFHFRQAEEPLDWCLRTAHETFLRTLATNVPSAHALILPGPTKLSPRALKQSLLPPPTSREQGRYVRDKARRPPRRVPRPAHRAWMKCQVV